jgi:hypothetical protein
MPDSLPALGNKHAPLLDRRPHVLEDVADGRKERASPQAAQRGRPGASVPGRQGGQQRRQVRGCDRSQAALQQPEGPAVEHAVVGRLLRPRRAAGVCMRFTFLLPQRRKDGSGKVTLIEHAPMMGQH